MAPPKRRDPARLPDWADEWVPGRCGCGGRVVKVWVWGTTDLACATSGWGIEKCPDVPGRADQHQDQEGTA